MRRARNKHSSGPRSDKGENLESLFRAIRDIRVGDVRRLLPLVDKAHLSHCRDSYRGMTALGLAVSYWNSTKAIRIISFC